jgi:hypoxanthine phosphoribosyltransferase
MSKIASDTEHIQVHELLFEPLLSAQQVQDAVQRMGEDISLRFKGKNPLFVAVLNGAFVFAADLIRSLSFDAEIAFIKVSSYQNLQSTGNVHEMIGLDKEISGRPVIVVEDIVDTGHTVNYLMNLLLARGASEVVFAAFLLKDEAYQYDIPIEFVGFRIPNRFVIGYGLDYNHYGRGLRGIYVLKE